MSKKFVYSHIGFNGCCLHRIVWPFRFLEQDIPHLDCDLSVSDPVGNYHYYMTLGTPPQNNLQIIGNWKRRGGKWVWVLDDDYETVPEWNHCKQTEAELDVIALCKDAADVIWVSTPALVKAVGRPEKTICSPNLMPVSHYGIDTPAPVDGGPLRILWSGSRTHTGDLYLIEDLVDEILKKWGPQKVEFIFFGSAPDRAVKRWLHQGLHVEKGVPMSLYTPTVKAIRPHIVLAPLQDCPFNEAKSNIRTIEAGCVAAPVVASPVGEYKSVRHGVDGFHASSTEEWVYYVDKLLGDRELREQMGAAGRKRVAEDFDWANPKCREPWRQCIKELELRIQK